MADDAAKQLLARFTVDTSAFQAAIVDAKKMLSDLDSEETGRAAKSKASAQEAVASIKEQVAQSQAQVAAAKAVTAAEQAKTAELKTQAEAAKTAAQIQIEQARAVEALSKAAVAQAEQAAKQKTAASKAEAAEALNAGKIQEAASRAQIAAAQAATRIQLENQHQVTAAIRATAEAAKAAAQQQLAEAKLQEATTKRISAAGITQAVSGAVAQQAQRPAAGQAAVVGESAVAAETQVTESAAVKAAIAGEVLERAENVKAIEAEITSLRQRALAAASNITTSVKQFIAPVIAPRQKEGNENEEKLKEAEEELETTQKKAQALRALRQQQAAAAADTKAEIDSEANGYSVNIAKLNAELAAIKAKAAAEASANAQQIAEAAQLNGAQSSQVAGLRAEGAAQAQINAQAARAVEVQLAGIKAEAAAKAAAAKETKSTSAEALSALAAESREYDIELTKIRAVIAALNEKNAAQRKGGHKSEGGEGEEGGAGEHIKGFAEAGIAGTLGGGAAGQLAMGVLGGAAIGTALEVATEGFEKLLDKMKEFIEDSGKLQTVSNQFDALARGRGDAPAELLDKMTTATQHLVPEIDLMRAAQVFMSSGLKVSNEDMIKLVASTANLARANGQGAPQAVEALQRAFLRGGRSGRELSTIIGVQIPEGLGRGAAGIQTFSQKAQTSFDELSKIVNKRSDEIGSAPITYSERLKQISNISNEAFEGLGQGTVKSAGFGLFTAQVDQMIASMGGLEEAGNKLGDSLGNIFAVIGGGFKDAIAVVKALASALGLSGGEAVELGKSAEGAANATVKSVSSITKVTEAILIAFTAIKTLILNVISQLQYLEELDEKISNGGPRKVVNSIIRTSNYGLGTNMKEVEPDAQETEISKKSFAQLAQENHDRQRANMDAGNAEIAGSIKTLESPRVVDDRKTKPTPVQEPIDANRIRQERLALTKAELEESKKNLDAQLEAAKENIAAEQALNEENYSSGLESAKQYYNTKRQLADATYENSVKKIKEEAAAQRASLQEEQKLNRSQDPIVKRTFAVRERTVTEGEQQQIAAAGLVRDRTNAGTDRAEQADTRRAQTTGISDKLQQTKDQIAQETAAIESAYKQGDVDSETYYNKRLELIKADVAATETAEAQKMAIVGQSAQAQAESAKTVSAAVEAALKQVQDLKDNSLSDVVNQVQKQSGEQMDSLQTRLQISQSGSNGANLVGGADGIQKQMQATIQSQINGLEQLLKSAQPYSDEWYNIYNSILKATQQQAQLNEQIEESQNKLTAVGGLFSQIGQEGQGLFGSRYARGLESTFTNVGKQFSTSSQLANQIRGGSAPVDPNVKKITDTTDGMTSVLTSSTNKTASALDTLVAAFVNAAGRINGTNLGNSNSALPSLGGQDADEMQLKSPDISTQIEEQKIQGDMDLPTVGDSGGGGGMFGGIGKLFSGLTGSASTAGTVANLTQKIQGMASAASGFIATITQSGSRSSGALGGALGGASTTSTIGKGIGGGVGDFLGSSLGMGLGAGAGLLAGLIGGEKQEQVVDDINSLNLTYKGIMDSYSTNNSSLNATIASLQALIATAQKEMASTKKGSSQFTSLINSYNAQITQLQDQSQQTVAQMQQQLAILNEPTQFQQALSGVSQILQQYEQFAGAATNATELAQANQFLTQSLQQLAEQDQEQLLSDEEQGVNAALQLNQLLNQRNQLQYQYLQQQEQIMGQGNLTRGETSAQSKYAQLYQANVSYSQQMDQLNQQIAVTQYQVTAYSQIFQMAQTKAGLEAQSVALQEQSINLDTARIAAMQDLVNTLQSTGYSITNLNGISNSDPNSTILNLLNILLGLLNQNGTGSSTSSTISVLTGLLGSSTTGLSQQGVGGLSSLL